MAKEVKDSEKAISERVRAELCQLHIESKSERCGISRVAGLHAGDVDVVRFSGSGIQYASRRNADISVDSEPYYILSIPSIGCFQTRYLTTWADAKPGQAFLISTRRRFQTIIRPEVGGIFNSLHIRVRGTSLRQKIPHVDSLIGCSLPVNSSPGRILLSLLDSSIREGSSLHASQAEQLGSLVLSALVYALEAASSCQVGTVPTGSNQRAQFNLQRARDFIDRNLGKKYLSAQLVAGHCDISLRTLHRIFAEFGSPVSSYIRELRLMRCRAAIKDPRSLNRTIIDICEDFGFDDQPQFSKLYKKRFGLSPANDRRCLSRTLML